jgi:hypothetical protein
MTTEGTFCFNAAQVCVCAGKTKERAAQTKEVLLELFGQNMLYNQRYVGPIYSLGSAKSFCASCSKMSIYLKALLGLSV